MRYKTHAALAISILFSTGAIMNLGMTGAFWGFPYFVALIALIWKMRRKHQIITVVLLTIFWLPWIPKDKNPLYFSTLGASLTFKQEQWCANQYPYPYDNEFEHYHLTPLEQQHFRLNGNTVDSFCLSNDTSYTIINALVTSEGLNNKTYLILLHKSTGKTLILTPFDVKQGLLSGTITSDDITSETQHIRAIPVYLSSLMYYPVLPIFVLVYIQSQIS
ncbi:hypothetical protein AB4254_08155 [Vibrio breoganii]